jgi:hypothetical protein
LIAPPFAGLTYGKVKVTYGYKNHCLVRLMSTSLLVEKIRRPKWMILLIGSKAWAGLDQTRSPDELCSVERQHSLPLPR